MPAIRTDVVLPCLNEAQALPRVLAALPDGCRAIVVDNGSVDGSASIAAEHGALVVSEAQRGFGAAVHAGMLAATAPIVAVCDADGSFDLRELSRVIEPVARGDVELALGGRRPVVPGAWPWTARLANRVLARRVTARTGVPLTDLGPMRAMPRAAALDLAVRDRRSGYPLELVLRASAAGWRIREVPVSYHRRLGRSKVTGTVRGTITAVRDMSRVFGEVPA